MVWKDYDRNRALNAEHMLIFVLLPGPIAHLVLP